MHWITKAGACALFAGAMFTSSREAAAGFVRTIPTRAFLAPESMVIAPEVDNYVYTPDGPRQDRLVVFFTGSSLDENTDFMTLAAARGYHVIGLDSPLTHVGFD